MEIINYDNNGRGIGYLNNKIVFVSNTVIGEDVNVKIIEDKSKYSVGEVINFNKKSENRINKCPYFSICGGCDIMHLPYGKQLEYKENKVRDVLKKFYGKDIEIKKIISTNPYNYRNKVSLKVNNGLGYYKKNSHDIVNINNCDLVLDEINDFIKVLNNIDLKNNKDIIIRSTDSGIMVVFDSEIDYELIKPYVSSIYLLNKKIYGDIQYENIGDLKFVISPLSFFQVNKYNTINLYNKVLEYANLTGNEVVLDLYCGTGTIGSFVSKKAKKVIGIEINEDSIHDALINKDINNLSNIEFICGDSGKVLFSNKYKNIDITIVDPPRAGLSDLAIKEILKINSKKIIYVSCDVVTLARDLKILSDNYNVMELTPVDMFPNTYHCESVVILERK